MKLSVTKTFRKRLNQLPATVQEQAEKAYALWLEDPYHTSLQFKRVSQRQPIYSARVSLNYRVLGLLESDDHIYWFWIGAHDEYDELLKRL
ncbi:MAG: type II toxin-antitoxin system RelE/ParE family toxin [Stenomitos frigidus ULC029]